MEKRYLLLVIINALFLIFIWNKNKYSFIPSAQTCGAAVKREGTTPASFEQAIQCMLAGYKDVYLGNVAGFIFERIPDEYTKQEIQLITLPNGNFLLYTQKGERNARLLEKAIKEEARNSDSFDERNHYQFGHLLGYREDDIQYFYEKNNLANYEQDKNDTLSWLEHNQK